MIPGTMCATPEPMGGNARWSCAHGNRATTPAYARSQRGFSAGRIAKTGGAFATHRVDALLADLGHGHLAPHLMLALLVVLRLLPARQPPLVLRIARDAHGRQSPVRVQARVSFPMPFDEGLASSTRSLSATLCVLPAREEQILQDISTRSDICAVIFGVILPRHDGVLIPLGAPLTVLAPYRDLLAGWLFLFCGAR